MANVRITSLPLLTDILTTDSYTPATTEFVVEENGTSYKITGEGILENSSSSNANFGNTTITGSFTSQGNVLLGSEILLNSDQQNGTPTLDASLSVLRGNENTVSLTWDETNNRWDFGNFPVKAQTFITEDAESEVEYVLATAQIEAGDGLAGGGFLSDSPGIQVAPNGIQDTMLRDSTGVSVIGRAEDTLGDPADIVAENPNTVLRYDGSELGFDNINNDMLIDNTINASKLVNNSVTSSKLSSSITIPTLSVTQTLVIPSRL